MTTVKINLHWQTRADASRDAKRVARMLNIKKPVIEVRERSERLGGGFAWEIDAGSVTAHCQGLTRYRVRYCDQENHCIDCEAVTAEAAIQELMQTLSDRIDHAARALLTLKGSL